MRSSVASRAVSISTGVHTSRDRSSRQTAKPSSPGSITSSTIASYAPDPRHPERVLAAPGRVDDVSLLAQTALEQRPQLRLVLDHQQLHTAIVAPGT